MNNLQPCFVIVLLGGAAACKDFLCKRGVDDIYSPLGFRRSMYTYREALAQSCATRFAFSTFASVPVLHRPFCCFVVLFGPARRCVEERTVKCSVVRQPVDVKSDRVLCGFFNFVCGLTSSVSQDRGTAVPGHPASAMHFVKCSMQGLRIVDLFVTRGRASNK